ncbi:MAG: riboflavin synthase [Clostridia bacterium]|nr:riboflavin synthase [Clostridia bacterium]
MFAGIIEEVGTIKNIYRGSKSIRLSIECIEILKDVKTGDSISVNGICLTVTELGNNWFAADVMPETMSKTNLDKLQTKEKVNLERALRLSDRLGGHIVTGHIDGTGIIIEKADDDNAVWLTIEAPQPILRYMVPKGSVALDGTSLTIVHVDEKYFKVSLIPLTRGYTTLGTKKIKDMVNIECDVIGKYVEKLVYGHTATIPVHKGISPDFLKDHGFM